MNKGINLVGLEARKTIQFIRLRKKAQSMAMSFLGVFVVVSLLTLGAFFYFGQILKANEQKISGLKNEIKSMEKTESYLITIDDRVKGVTKIMEERKSYLGLLSDLELLSVPGFKMDGLELKSNGDLTLSGYCTTKDEVYLFNQKVEELAGKKEYSSITYPTVDGLGGKYNLTLELKR